MSKLEEKEIWRWVKGFRGCYKISSRGRVKSVTRFVNGINGHMKTVPARIRKPSSLPTGYLIVPLSKNGVNVNYYLHRLVAEAFIPNPEGKPEINHKDFNRKNNHTENLEWITVLENRRYSRQHGRCGYGESHSNSKLSNKKTRKIRRLYATGKFTQRELAKRFNVSRSLISYVSLRKGWKHV